MNDKQGADDSANMTVEYDDWHYENQIAREIDAVPSQAEAPHLYDWATLALAIAGIIAIVGMFTLALLGKPVPEGIGTLGGVALGALAGMVAVSRK